VSVLLLGVRFVSSVLSRGEERRCREQNRERRRWAQKNADRENDK